MEFGATSHPNGDLRAVEAEVDACFETPLSCLDHDAKTERLITLNRLSAKVDALKAAAIDDARQSGLAATNGQRNTANHLASVTNVDPADIRFSELIAVWLRDFPSIANAYRNGEITTAHVDKLRLLDEPRFHHVMQRDEEVLLDALRHCHFRDLDTVFNEWLLGADPDGVLPKEDTPKTFLTITPVGGGFSKLSGLLDPLQTQALKNSIDAETKKLRKCEVENKTRRTVGNRRLSALLRVLARGAARKNGSFPMPLVNVSVSQRVAENTVARLVDPTIEPVPINAHDPDGRCHLIDGTPIHPMYALAAMAIGQFRRTVYDAEGKPVETSSLSRTFPNWLRDLLAIQTNGHCSNPVCDAPFHWLHADHIDPYSVSQDTSLANGQMLCEAENLWKGDDPSRANFNRPMPEAVRPSASLASERDDDVLDREDPAEVLEMNQLARERVRKFAEG